MLDPVCQTPLQKLPLLFRFGKYMVTADIQKMYPEIKLRPSDQPFQRIIKSKKANQLAPFQLSAVTFELASSSYLETFALSYHADFTYCPPNLASSLKTCLFVSDQLQSFNS
jgi:hypothetical protein